VSTAAVTKMKLDLVLDSGSSFNQWQAKAEVARATGVDPDKVVIEAVVHKVKVTYTFSAVVNETTAQKSIAEANNVPVGNVNVTITPVRRRLMADWMRSARRLAGVDVKAVIQAENADAAKQLQTKASDTSAVAQKLAENGVTATAAVKESPKQAIEMKIRISSKTRTPVSAPDFTKLAEIGSALGGTATVKDVEEVVPALGAVQGSTSGSAGLSSRPGLGSESVFLALLSAWLSSMVA